MIPAVKEVLYRLWQVIQGQYSLFLPETPEMSFSRTFFNDPNNEIIAIETDLINGVQVNLNPLTDATKTTGSNSKRFLSGAWSSFIQVGTTPAAAGAIRLANAASINWRNAGNTADATAMLLDASNNLLLATPGGTQLKFIDAASLVNFLQITAKATGASPDLAFVGGDATVGGTISTKGGIQLKFIDVASIVNFLQFAGTATGADPTLSVQGDATRNLILSLPGTSALLPRADVVTAFGSATLGYTKVYLRGTGGVIRYDDTTIMGLTIKRGSQNGTDYTTASTTYVDVDATNLALTITIPVGWKLAVIGSGNLFNTTSAVNDFVRIVDGTTAIAEMAKFSNANSEQETWSLVGMISGDGASHTIKLQFAASGGTLHLENNAFSTTTTTQFGAQAMQFILMPSN